ncbi:GumC family protein [Pseudorhizobium endolithicum]|nr:polysaccharide biosynthesis tyrosine autokinase [Pseudorhizobium endolithicum]
MAQRVFTDLQEKGIIIAGQQSKSARVDESASSSDAPMPELSEHAKRVVEDLVNHVRVVNDGRSYTIYISYDAGNPSYAAMVANAFGEAYIDYQMDLQHTATRRVSEWLAERLISLREKLEASERAVTAFREEAGLAEIGEVTLEGQQLSGLNTEFTNLQARAAAAKARLETALEIQRGGESLGMIEVLSSPAIQQLRSEQARIARAITEISESGARKNSQLPQLESQLASLKRQIAAEISQVVDSLRNEIAVNAKQQEQMVIKLKELQDAIAANGQKTVKLRQLEREAAANRTIYEAYLGRYKQTVEQEGIAAPEARIISRAMPSSKPISPNPVLWAIMALLGGTIAGVGAALLLSLSNRSVRSISVLQQKTGLPVIGRIPKVPPGRLGKERQPFSDSMALCSAFLDLHAHIRLEDKARVIAVTSSVEREGRSFITANLAKSLALSGLRVIVVDADLRTPSMHREFDLAPSQDLARAVVIEDTTHVPIQRDHLAGVDVVLSQTSVTSREAILGTRRLAPLIADLRDRYDLVLIDTPAASDGVNMTRVAMVADAVVLVTQQGRVNPDILQNAVITLKVSGKHIAGIILNGIGTLNDGAQSRQEIFLGLLGLARFFRRTKRPIPSRPLVATAGG